MSVDAVADDSQGRDPLRLGAWRVHVVAEEAPVSRRTLVLEEEDRFRVLSAPAVIPETTDHPIRVFDALWSFEPEPLGAIVEVSATRWLAVVHDLDASPTLDRTVAVNTLSAALDRAAAARMTRVTLHPWGVRHGPWSLADALGVLAEILRDRWRPPLSRIDLRIDAARRDEVRHRLASHF